LILLKIGEDYELGGADPLDNLEQNAFKSFAGFLEWLMFRKYSNKGMHKRHPEFPLKPEKFSVQSNTFYRDVQLNSEIPIEIFTTPRLVT